MNARQRIFVALDTPDPGRAVALARELSGRVGGVKIGAELFTSAGPEIVRRIRDGGTEVFLDLKLHDIPNTVAGAAAATSRLGVSFFTLHALGGQEMIRRAVEACARAAPPGRAAPVALAVTILTSHDDAGLARIGLAGGCRPAVERLAALSRDAGAGGIVCSPLEIEPVRRIFPAAVIVVPGIRPARDLPGGRDDQARTSTAAQAVRAGADRIVVGRPVTASPDPAAAAEAIAREIEAA